MRCVLILLSFLICGKLLQADSSPSRIAAVVNNSLITKADLMNRLRFAAISSGLEPTLANLEKIKPQMLRVMIDELLQLNLGREFGIEISPKNIKEAIKDIELNNGMPEGTITQMMNENNIPLKVFEDQIKAQLIWVVFIREKYPLKTLEDQVRKKFTQNVLPSLQIADWEIDQELKAQTAKGSKTQFHLAEIFIPVDHSGQEESAKNNISQLIEELQKGAHFSALAQQFSQSATAAQGGDMGWLSEDQLDPIVAEALAHMEPGQLSVPLRTSQGFVIIAFIERKLPGADGQIFLTMQQALFPFPKDVTEEKAREIMTAAEAIFQKVKSCPDLEKLAKDVNPSVSLHLTENESLSNFPAPLQKIINSLEINQTSQPLLTQEGALLITICNKKHQKTENFTREDAQNLIISRKHSLLGARELRDLRRHAFIDIRM
ncbi:MAG: peptidylprolyl isomerase [Alphaproteobacteria bacterium]|nr:peptidylprolyl isomerase [Alphaproteobacteria bacterium]